jgi:hypothetical protein
MPRIGRHTMTSILPMSDEATSTKDPNLIVADREDDEAQEEGVSLLICIDLAVLARLVTLSTPLL